MSIERAPGQLDRSTLSDLLDRSSIESAGERAAETGTVSERLLALLTSSAVRKGSLDTMQFARCRADLLQAIARRVAADEPLQLTLMAFPFKVPNAAKVGPRRLPDFAELLALARLRQLNANAQRIHPPGLDVHILHDGAYIGPVFGVAVDEVREYERYFATLVRVLGMDGFVHLHDLEAVSDGRVGDPAQHDAHLRASIRA